MWQKAGFVRTERAAVRYASEQQVELVLHREQSDGRLYVECPILMQCRKRWWLRECWCSQDEEEEEEGWVEEENVMSEYCWL